MALCDDRHRYGALRREKDSIMYVRDTDPLPPNSQAPSSDCYDWGVCLQQSMAQSVANAQAASAQIAGPESFAEFGPAVVIDVARSQNDMAAANLAVTPSQPPNVSGELMAAPRVLPLNVSPEEYSGCSFRTGVILPIVVPKQSISLPPTAPAPVTITPGGIAPKYSNLCWALRNGAVDQSQFDPSQFQALQYRCTQLGYAGACIPPPNVALWLDQQRRAGTLPHISVSDTDLDGIPQAPDLTAVTCPQSWSMGGMTGYRRGMGAAWGDAGSVPQGGGWSAPSVSGKWAALLFFGALGVGLYVMAGSNGRG